MGLRADTSGEGLTRTDNPTGACTAFWTQRSTVVNRTFDVLYYAGDSTASTYNNGVMVMFGDFGNRLEVWLRSTAFVWQQAAGVALAANTTYDVAVVYNTAASQAGAIYIWAHGSPTNLAQNGSGVNTFTGGNSGTAVSENMYWGDDPTGDAAQATRIMRPRVWNAALTEEELLRERQSRVAVRRRDLWAGWTFQNDAAGIVDYSGNSRNLTESGTVTVEDDVGAFPFSLYQHIFFGASAAAADNDIAAAGSVSISGAAAINATGSIASTGALSIAGAAALTAIGALLTAGSVSIAGAADLDAVGGLAAAGTVSVSGAADLNASGALVATGAVAVSGVADLDAIGGLVSAGSLSISGAAALSGSVNDIAAAGSISVTGAAALAAIGQISATGSLSVVGVSSLGGSVNDIAASGSLTIAGASALHAIGQLAATGAVSVTGAADLSGLAANDLVAAGSLSINGSATPSAVGVLSAAGSIVIVGKAQLASDASLPPESRTARVIFRQRILS